MKRIKAVILAAAIMFSLTPANITLTGVKVFAADTVTASIDTGVTHQTIEGFGASIAYYGNWLTAHPNKAEIYNCIFKDMGLSVLRLGNWYRYKTGEFEAPIKEIVTEANKSLGHTPKILMSSWSPPAELKSNNSVNGGTLKKENGSFVYSKFADYWYDSLQAYSAIGVNPDYISIQNEPDIQTDYDSCAFDATEGTNAAYGKALDAVYNKLKTMPNSPKILGPEVLGIGYGNMQKYTPNINLDQLDGYAFHLYHGGDEKSPDTFNDSLSTILKNYSNKPRFQTEYYRGDAFQTAWIIHNALTKGDVSTYLYWHLIWDNAGLVSLENPWNKSSWKTEKGYVVSDSYYMMKQYAKFIQPGYKRIDASVSSDNVKISAYISPDSKALTVVMLNTADAAQNVALNFKGYSAGTSEIYRTGGTDKAALVGSLDSSNSVNLPAKSVTTISLTNTIDLGDVNGDGNIDALDFSMVKMYLLGKTTDINTNAADMNKDGSIDAIDFALLKAKLLQK